jgi:hypothetical protein
MTERRKFLRFPTDVNAEYRGCREKEISGVSCIKDLSREGMRFSISRKLDTGTLLDMKFMLPGDEKPIYLTGEVIWANEPADNEDSMYLIGVKIYKIDNFDRVRLLDHAYTEWLRSSKSN